MSDYREQTARPSTGDIGTPALFTRNDPGGDISAANQNMAQGQLGSDGALKVNIEGMKTTYSITVLDIALAATPTDVFILNGSATKTVKVSRVEAVISGATGAAAVADIQLVVRSSANTGGTSTNATSVAHDSNSSAATSVGKFYTANPSTLGTAVGAIRGEKLAYATPGATIGPASLDAVIWDFGTRPGCQQPTLRGVAQGLAVNLNGSTLGGTSTMTLSIELTEEPNTV